MGKKSELDDLRARVATLEAEVDRLRGEAAAAGRAPAVAAGPPQSMTRIADAVGVMVSGRAEQPTRVLQARTGSAERRTATAPEPATATATAPASPEPAEPPDAMATRSLPVPAHGQFLESLLSGR